MENSIHFAVQKYLELCIVVVERTEAYLTRGLQKPADPPLEQDLRIIISETQRVGEEIGNLFDAFPVPDNLSQTKVQTRRLFYESLLNDYRLSLERLCASTEQASLSVQSIMQNPLNRGSAMHSLPWMWPWVEISTATWVLSPDPATRALVPTAIREMLNVAKGVLNRLLSYLINHLPKATHAPSPEEVHLILRDLHDLEQRFQDLFRALSDPAVARRAPGTYLAPDTRLEDYVPWFEDLLWFARSTLNYVVALIDEQREVREQTPGLLDYQRRVYRIMDY
ncbi:hypothetical protein N7492_009987 [Penicillium capsulatum]|uniref:Uncharacterized protein n=1 Tax=Penicillium capsulatum TaxID=69766 RepID=A0A9W9HNP2_9EURO|nr:hypothetical protein N7492_009987 [Penicillium capsulatum]KAJ6112496.1 hypothetical protein N7512_007820 [Penicillium capsulatum]